MKKIKSKKLSLKRLATEAIENATGGTQSFPPSYDPVLCASVNPDFCKGARVTIGACAS